MRPSLSLAIQASQPHPVADRSRQRQLHELPRATALPHRLSMQNASRIGAMAADVQARSAVEANALGFASQLLVQASLPHRDPGDVIAWSRRNGAFTLTVQPGVEVDAKGKPQSLGLPFGTYARLIFCWMSTEAIKTKSRTLHLGDSFNAFMRKLQLQRTGGEKGTQRALNEQLRRLMHASVSWSFQRNETTSGADIGQGVFPVETRNVFWDVEHPERRTGWNSSLSLSPTFFEHVLENHVPVDLRVVRELARLHSSLAIDIYSWLTHRMFRLKKRTHTIPWTALMQQLGTGHAQPKEFARDFRKELLKVRVLYPGANVEVVRGGLRLLPSKTHVATATAAA
jgi:hypothetical protein